MINAININNLNTCNQTTFKAKPLAEYGFLSDKKLIVYQLEKQDIGYVKHILKNLEKFYKKYQIYGESAKQVLSEALGASIALLEAKLPLEEKARILMSFCDSTPSSILIGNALKVDKKGGFHYSSRKEHGFKEGELDFLVTWNNEIPKEGQATVNEYFHTSLEDGFNDSFVRSELLQNSSAVNFYPRRGYHQLSKRPRPILRKNDYPYAVGKYDDKADKIIPMLITKDDIIKITNEKDVSLKRKKINTDVSVTLPFETFD